MSKSEFDPRQIDPSRITFASQDGVDQFEAWEQKILQRIENHYGVRPGTVRVKLVDLFCDIELQRRASTRQ